MPPRSHNREILFPISDVARLLRTYADQKARLFGMTRAQWAVLLRWSVARASTNPTSPKPSTSSRSR